MFDGIYFPRHECAFLSVYVPEHNIVPGWSVGIPHDQMCCKKYSGCNDYFEVAVEAIGEMSRQTGKPTFDNDGHMQKGTVVRHLVLPSLYKDGIEAFTNLVKKVDPEDIAVSIMCQYFPTHLSEKYPEINRKTTTLEYMKVVDFVRTLGFRYGFMQEKESAKKEYVPKFDYGE